MTKSNSEQLRNQLTIILSTFVLLTISRFCSKRKFLSCLVKPVKKGTTTWDTKYQPACVVQATVREKLTHAKEIVEGR